MLNLKKFFKSFSLLEKHEKKNLVILFSLMSFAYLLETASIGSIIPLLVFLSEAQNSSIFNFLNNIKFLQHLTQTEKLQFFILIFLFFFILKNIFLVFFRWFQLNFTAKLSTNLSVKLFRKYLRQPYLFFVQQKSSNLIRNVMIENTRFATNVVETFANLILEILVIITLTLILFIYDAKSFIFVITISASVFLLYNLLTKGKIFKWAKKRAMYEAKVIHKLQTGFNLSKIIKVFFKNKKFDDEYHTNIKGFNFVIRNRGLLNKLPRHLFEIIGVISLSSLVIYFTSTGKEFGEIIILLGMFAAVMYRIFPAIINIIVNLQSIQFNFPSIDILISAFNRPNYDEIYKINNQKKVIFNKNISLKNISFKYPNSKKNTLNKINFEIQKNQIVGIAGSSGSGKTTLIDILLGILKPDSGTFKVDGKTIKNNQLHQWGKLLGYVPQGVYLIDDTIEKNIAFGGREKNLNKKQIISCAKKAQIHEFIMSLPKKYKTTISERGSNLSEGQKQRVAIARALYQDPKILIFDEATSALDFKTEKKFIDGLRTLKNKKTIILIAHRYSILQFCQKTYFFDLNKNFKKVEKKYLKQIS